MTRRDVVYDWLERRDPAAPARLVARMHAALDRLDREPEDMPSALGSAAMACLRDALGKGNHRDAALDLLAADGLLTYGCEVAAQAGASALDRFANDYGASRLAVLLPDHRPDAPPPGVGMSDRRPVAKRRSQSRSAAQTTPAAESVAQHLRRLAGTAEAVASQLAEPIADVAGHVARTFERGGKLLFCGNGGSAADAQHLATEYVVRFRCTRRPLPAIALTTDTSLLTAASNDLGFEQVFARQVYALARDGDFLFLHSTSGNSANLVAAAQAARERNVTTAALLAHGGGELKDVVDYAIVLPTDDGAHAQELHLAIGHAICDIVERTIDA